MTTAVGRLIVGRRVLETRIQVFLQQLEQFELGQHLRAVLASAGVRAARAPFALHAAPDPADQDVRRR